MPLRKSNITSLLSKVFSLLPLVLLALCIDFTDALAQAPATNDPPQLGPYNAQILTDGTGLRMPLANPHDSLLLADSPWSMYCWVKTQEAVKGLQLVAGLGNVTADTPRFLAIQPDKIALWMGHHNSLTGPAQITPGEWHLLAATFDGSTFRIYSDKLPAVSGSLALSSVNPVLQIAPAITAEPQANHFGGWIAGFTILRRALTEQEIHNLQQVPPDFALLQFEQGSKQWPFQTRGQAGYRAPQDPSTMPHSRAALSLPAAHAHKLGVPSLQQSAPAKWTLSDGWSLKEAPKVNADAQQIAQPSFSTTGWIHATVPGTVLTSMVDDGIYPDPDFGLNNLAIPESLNKQDYWYRNEFLAPTSMQGRHLELTFAGINYKAQIWLNGQLLGAVTGAFNRGQFDVTASLKPGQKNVLAVRISPPPHPGIPQEQSILGGPGENGGTMELDGPTFLATEGWDWIPAIRDRNAGIWQPVTIKATDLLKLGDAQVITSLPLPDIAHADIEISVPIRNLSQNPLQARLLASFEGTSLAKTLTLPPGESIVNLAPEEFAQLRLQHPRLWWPNGYGKPELYHLKLTLQQGAATSDTAETRFGIREITYELSLLDALGHLQRVEYAPTKARTSAHPVVDVSHEGMREIPLADADALNLPEQRREAMHSWAASIAPGAEASPALRALADTRAAPYLVIKVNGVRIAARGGNWGMDDSRKRVSREHLEPYFRLHRDANLNIIRNWVGQNTEETFYDLADEYGMLVWNDFWESTQNYNIEAQDPALFLINAKDTIMHFRNHPSIAIWCGRNEGVPQPILNQGLDELVRSLDGTRYYSPSSNQVNLQNSGPYSYKNPALYFSMLNRGFSVETGTPSMSTLESFRSTIAKEDQWPIGDAWAYHDWHQSGNGDTAPFMDELQSEFGAPTGLEDFERKAQMLNYVDHRAIFEGMNANLWSPNSGRMLWMTQPAWPSTMWQIFSSDYDTQASFYATRKACEPVHIQLNLATHQVNVINTTTAALTGLKVSAKVFSLDNQLLFQSSDEKSLDADSAVDSLELNLAPYLAHGMVLVKLELTDNSGKLLSDNLYWLGATSTSYRELTHLPSVPLQSQAKATRKDRMVDIEVSLKNTSTTASLATKLTLLGAKDRQRILPAYFTDNYISLLPGESKTVIIEYPADRQPQQAVIALRGWNTTPATIPVVDTK